MRFLLLAPTVLCVLVFCASLFRSGLVILIPPLLISLGLMFFKSGVVARYFQLLLLGVAAYWAFRAIGLGLDRAEEGAPWLRMALILGGVALFNLLAAALWESKPLLRHYPRGFFSPGPEELDAEV
ncbi:MAG: hypothetical protein HUU28_00980 [Planctomycetaceae bacterium]|jgi:hypothetical protein|nr:hypothetical protein [Planctomycetaceae bacterium]